MSLEHTKNKNISVHALKSEGYLLSSSGKVNRYREAFLTGLGASVTDQTFDKSKGVKGMHICCGSKVCWRHKMNCPRISGPDDLSDLKDI